MQCMTETSSKTNWWLAGFGVLLFIGILGSIGWALFWGVSSAWGALSELDKTVAVAVQTASCRTRHITGFPNWLSFAGLRR